MSDDRPILEAHGVRKIFGTLEVLGGIDLRVARNEVVTVIGPSGSGKSTFLRCLNRLEEPDGGRILIDGAEVTARTANLNRLRQSVGMVFQQFNLYPHMTALANVSLALRKVQRLPRREAEARARDALAQVGLSEKAEQHPNELSGGQQQRVGIARALALQPKLMLFDEPTSSLDPELVGEVLNVMRRMRDDGMTMIVVTHEMSFAREAADRVVFMNAGRVVEEGPPQRIFGQPEHARTREFLNRVLGHLGH